MTLRIALALAATAVLAASACRRAEKAGSPATTAASDTAPAPTAAPDREEPPVLRAEPLPGRPPFAGLSEPRDGDVDRLGRVWIADFGHSRLRIFDRDGGDLGGWGGRGTGTYGFKDPCAVAVREDDVYVADTWNGRVQHFSLAGEWKGSATGLFGPRGVAAGPDGRVWVTDTGNHQVRAYDAALGASETFGKSGAGEGEFSSPVGIAVAASGKVYVADSGNRRIVILSPSGAFERAWPVSGWERAVEPHLEVDADGSVFVTDPGAAAAVLQIDPDGRAVQSWTATAASERFSLPTGVAWNRRERMLYVINRGNNSVLRLSVPKP